MLRFLQTTRGKLLEAKAITEYTKLRMYLIFGVINACLFGT